MSWQSKILLVIIIVISVLFYVYRDAIASAFHDITACENKTEDPYLQALYDKAVKDAEVIEENEYSDSLRVIADGNLKEGKVKVAAWMDQKGMQYYEAAKSDTIPYPYQLPVNLWVTLTPDLRDFCNKRSFKNSGELELRLEQLLGLPYFNKYQYMVELWVDTTFLRRATPNPAIARYKKPAIADQPEGDLAFNAWFAGNLNASYQNETKYPWTRLGYTYDWSNTGSEIGLSEFVILGKRYGPVTIWVDSIYTTEQYCNLVKADRGE